MPFELRDSDEMKDSKFLEIVNICSLLLVPVMKLILLPRGCFRETNFYTTGREKGGDLIQYVGYDYGFKMEKTREVSEN